ncbi:MAG: hypothetical protein ACSLE0_07150 [Chitinophagaceae bacterium]
MKKTSALSAVFFGAFILLLSCSKNAKDSFSRPDSAVPDRIINASIVQGQSYILTISTSGEATISKQASHFLVSETGIDEKNGALIYKYIPAAGFIGTDEVSLSHRTEIYKSGNGCNYGGDSRSSYASSIAIKINVGK